MTEPQKLTTWERAKILAVYYPTLVYNVLLSKVLRVRPWWNRVDDCVVLGALPFAADARRLYEEEGVRGVINTCMEYVGPVDEYERLGVVQLWTPTVDFTHPSLESLWEGVRFIERFAERGESVYVHCKAGRARSATVVACWLMKSQGMSPEAAQALMLARRPHVNPRIAQRPVVLEFAAKLAAEAAGDAAPPAQHQEDGDNPQNGSPGQ